MQLLCPTRSIFFVLIQPQNVTFSNSSSFQIPIWAPSNSPSPKKPTEPQSNRDNKNNRRQLRWISYVGGDACSGSPQPQGRQSICLLCARLLYLRWCEERRKFALFVLSSLFTLLLRFYGLFWVLFRDWTRINGAVIGELLWANARVVLVLVIFKISFIRALPTFTYFSQNHSDLSTLNSYTVCFGLFEFVSPFNSSNYYLY